MEKARPGGSTLDTRFLFGSKISKLLEKPALSKRGSLVIMISWINNNMILGPEDLVMQVKANLLKQFECNNCEHLKEYVGDKIK